MDLIQHPDWDLNIELKELVEASPMCKVNRNSQERVIDGVIVHLRYPGDSKYMTIIGATTEGFIYVGDGEVYLADQICPTEVPFEPTDRIMTELNNIIKNN